MRIDYIDILYFHMCDYEAPFEESLAAVEDLVSSDVVRYFAISNFTVDDLKGYQALEEKFSIRCRPVAVQNQYDIVRGESEKCAGMLEYAAQDGISFIGWSPLALGLLTERYLDMDRVGAGDRLYDEGNLKKVATEPVMEKVRQLAELSKEWDMRLSELALAYMLTIPGMGPVIPSCSSIEQLESNARAGHIEFEPEQKSRIKTILDSE